MPMHKTPIRIGYCLSLSGPLAANGQTARLAHQIWQERINARGGLVGREIELVCVDDRTDGSSVAGMYEALLAEEKVDLLLGGYGNNSISPAWPKSATAAGSPVGSEPSNIRRTRAEVTANINSNEVTSYRWCSANEKDRSPCWVPQPLRAITSEGI